MGAKGANGEKISANVPRKPPTGAAIFDTFPVIDNNDLLDPDFSDSYDHSEISYYKLDENDKKIELILENHFVNPPSNESGRYFLYITGLGTRQFDGSYISYLKLSNLITKKS